MVIAQTFLGICLAGAWAYYLLCVTGARHWHRSHKPATVGFTPPVSILKPLCGKDPQLYANLRSFCQLDYPAYQLLFGTLDPNDPALETARRLTTEFPDRDITLVAGGEIFGLNRKVCNLQNLRMHARYELLVLSDSDMRVGPDYLRRIVAPFQDPAVGLVTCPYRALQPQNLPAKLEALGIGADFMPGVMVARRLQGMAFAFGSTIALWQEILDAIGGFTALANELADDYLLGNGVHRIGKQVVLSDYVVEDVLGRESWREMWLRRLRWAKTSRAMRPVGYVGIFLTHGLPLGLLFLVASGFAPSGWAVFVTTVILRMITACWVARYTRDTNLPRLLPLLPWSDLVSFALYIASYWGKTITWRGERFRLGRRGRLEEV
jgi:ceramide glucosyltransferase